MQDKITAQILTFNGERLIEKCLSSLDFCDHIHVIDSGSTDRTLEIAERLGARIFHRDWTGAIDQHNYGLTLVKTPWVVTLDQDEYLSDELRQSVILAVENDPKDLAGFYCSRKSWYYDRFILHSGWYPDYLFRVFRKDMIKIQGTLPHEELRPTGPTEKLNGDIVHFPYQNLAEHLHKTNIYTQDAAGELNKKGKKSSLAKALGHGASRFLKQYVFQKGFLDGQAGFILAIHAFLYSFHKYLRVREMELQGKAD